MNAPNLLSRIADLETKMKLVESNLEIYRQFMIEKFPDVFAGEGPALVPDPELRDTLHNGK